jgi:putative DNA primase/helicase
VDVNLVYKEFIDSEKYPRKKAEIADSHEIFKSCGWVLKEDELVVDIDNLEKPKIEKIISLFNIKTQIVWTTRGVHFYFKKPQAFKGSKKVCPLGFEIEYKHSKNTEATTVKQNGELRIIENDGVREDLPEIFFTKRRLNPLLGMDEGEGRNNALFQHRMKIADMQQWQSILRFINNHVFATPLAEDEFQQISRDVKPEAKKNSEPEVADFILSKYKAVSYLGSVYWFESNEYIQDENLLKRLVFNEVGLQKTRYVDEIIKQMKYRAPIISLDKVFDIKLQNGILRDGQFYEVDYKEFTPYSIDIPFIPDTKPVKLVDDYINHLTNHDADYRKRLLEIMAHTLIVNKEFKRMLAKFFMFVGDGGNGKGTLLAIIRQILGNKNCSGLSIKQMVDERYFTTLQGKLVNLGDDVQDEAINNEQMKTLKNISTCDFVATRNLFEQSKEVELTLSLIFTTNHILKSFEKGESYKRRVDWLPMYGKPTKKDKNFIKKLTTPEALQYWIKLIVEAYARLHINEGFTESALVKDFNDKYHAMNNNVTEFLEDYEQDYFLGKRAPEAYDEYQIWAEENGLNVLGKKLFQEMMLKIHNLEIRKTTKNGKSIRAFTKVDNL